MGFSQAYNAYQNTNIKTASQGKLVVLLYEGAIKQLTLALQAFNSDGKIDAPKIEKYSANLNKAHEIITELQVSLDMSKGGQIAQTLMSLYVFFNNELLEANINHDKKKIEFVKDSMSQLLESWRVAANNTADESVPAAQSTLNIRG